MRRGRKIKAYADPPSWLVPGALVDYYSISGEPPTKTGVRVRSEPWQLGHGQWVVKIDGVAGGVAVEALRMSDAAVSDYDEPTRPRPDPDETVVVDVERLTDARIAYIIAANETAYVEPEGLAMAREIQERRAADLRPDEVPCIRRARNVCEAMRLGACNVDKPEYDRIIAALNRVLASYGVAP